jgi:hypothetical protein
MIPRYLYLICDPVYVNDREVSCLMYADDLVPLSQSYEGINLFVTHGTLR